MSAKHFVNDPSALVLSAVRSLHYTNPSLLVDDVNKIIYRKNAPRAVALVSGGGAGHEPSFTGFVGDGILRAAVSGTVFASPSVKQIYNCISKRTIPNAGVLLIVMNYTGDVLHFGLAREKAEAAGHLVDMVVVADDVGVGKEKSGKVGRRGIAGTVLVHKIAGAYAAAGGELPQVARLAQQVARNLVSMGSSLAHVHVPGAVGGEDGRGLREDEIELGMGIHNEQGSKRTRIPELPELVDTMLKSLLDPNDKDRGYLDRGDPGLGFVLLVNNLGGVSPLEMGAITSEVVQQLESKWNIRPRRIYSGTFMTSLNGNGFSITLLKLVDTGIGEGYSMLNLLDAGHETTGWQNAIKTSTWDASSSSSSSEILNVIDDSEEDLPTSNLKLDTNVFVSILSPGLGKVIASEREVNRLDTIVGDGDCGTALNRGAQAALDFLRSERLSSDAVRTMSILANVVEQNMDGTSGAIYSIFLNALTKGLRDAAGEASQASLNVWVDAAVYALKGLARYTPAQPGDRTLVDALAPFVNTLKETGSLQEAARRAREGAESTRGMKPKLGRTVYVGEFGDVPDPGAIGLAALVEGMANI